MFITPYYMPLRNNKTVSRVTAWRNEHDEFCLANNIPPAAKLLWSWLTRLGEGEEVEPDLEEFNDWVKRYRAKSYCRPTLKNALAKLVDCGIVNLIRQYTWNIVKIVTRPLEWLKPKKNLPERQQIYVLPTSNDDSSDTLIQKQQLSSPNHSLLLNEGFFFTFTETEVLTKPEHEIKLSLFIFKLRGGFEKLKSGNPEGWLRTCLQKRYWEEPRNYQALLREYGATTTWHELFPTPESCPDFRKYSDSDSIWELLTQPFQPKRE